MFSFRMNVMNFNHLLRSRTLSKVRVSLILRGIFGLCPGILGMVPFLIFCYSCVEFDGALFLSIYLFIYLFIYFS